jgi:hypothetical protein
MTGFASSCQKGTASAHFRVTIAWEAVESRRGAGKQLGKEVQRAGSSRPPHLDRVSIPGSQDSVFQVSCANLDLSIA